MITKLKLSSILFLFFKLGLAQQISGVYKIDQLLNRIENNDTTYIVNFWAIWCKPCIQELPAFDSLNVKNKTQAIKVLLVNLDFIENKEKVNAFLIKKQINAECVLLDEINGNSYIDKISTDWSGSIPATLFKYKSSNKLIEKKLHLSELEKQLREFTGK